MGQDRGQRHQKLDQNLIQRSLSGSTREATCSITVQTATGGGVGEGRGRGEEGKGGEGKGGEGKGGGI